MNKLFLLSIVVSMISGCAPRDLNPLGDPTLEAEAKAPLICVGKDECELYWQRAQIWVSRNSAWKIQTATDTIIETYSPVGGGDYKSAYRIEKNPKGDGKYQILTSVYCGQYAPACFPKMYDALISFKKFVKTGD